MTENELQPCPFCGGKPAVEYDAICCTDCGAMMISLEGEYAAAAWNRRVAPVTETMMAQRRLLADGVMSEREGYGLPAEVVVLARSIVYDEPAPAGDAMGDNDDSN